MAAKAHSACASTALGYAAVGPDTELARDEQEALGTRDLDRLMIAAEGLADAGWGQVTAHAGSSRAIGVAARAHPLPDRVRMAISGGLPSRTGQPVVPIPPLT